MIHCNRVLGNNQFLV